MVMFLKDLRITKTPSKAGLARNAFVAVCLASLAAGAAAIDFGTLRLYTPAGQPPYAEITLTDLAGDDNHWQAEIVSSQFAGIPRVKQHQLVYSALKGTMGGELHALALKTRAPDS